MAIQKYWFRFLVKDVITDNDAVTPYRYLSAKDAEKLRKQRQISVKKGLSIIYILQRFENGKGWVDA
jgi:hypothetical protein